MDKKKLKRTLEKMEPQEFLKRKHGKKALKGAAFLDGYMNGVAKHVSKSKLTSKRAKAGAKK